MDENNPKSPLWAKILTQFYFVIFFGSVVWCSMLATKRYNWQNDASTALMILLLSGAALILIASPHKPKTNNEKHKNPKKDPNHESN